MSCDNLAKILSIRPLIILDTDLDASKAHANHDVVEEAAASFACLLAYWASICDNICMHVYLLTLMPKFNIRSTSHPLKSIEQA